MLSDLGRLALALGALFGAWGVVASAVALRTGRDHIARSAARGVKAALGCALFVVFVTALAVYAGDLRVAFVAAHASVIMPAKFIAAAMLSDAGGALPALAAAVGLVSAGVAPRLADSREARGWRTVLTGGVLALCLGIAAVIAPLDVRAPAAVDGHGLAPELQNVSTVVQSTAYLLGTALSFGAFVLGAAALASRSVGEAWSRSIRPWNAATFIALSCGLFASACAAAVYPAREPWLADRTTTPWFFTCLVSAWLVQLDRGRQGADRAVMRLLLTTATFIAAASALALMGGFARPLGARAPSVMSWFGLVPVGAFAAVLALVRRGRGALADARAVTNEARSPLALGLSLAGVLLLMVTAAGSAWSRPHSAALADTEILRLRDPLGRVWSFKSQGVSTLKRENFASFTLTLLADRDSTRIGLLSAEARSYLLADDSDAAPPIAVGAVRHDLLIDTRVTIVDPDAVRPTVRITFVPFAAWLWPGAALLWLGIALHLVLRERRAA